MIGITRTDVEWIASTWWCISYVAQCKEQISVVKSNRRTTKPEGENVQYQSY